MSEVANKNLVKLIFISGDANHNKYYFMEKATDGATFKVEYGRVNCAKPQFETYPINLWEKKFNEKVKKGYTDRTDVFTETKSKTNLKISDDKDIEALILELQRYANVNVANTYLAAASVTKKQLELAQNAINNLANSFKKYYGKKTWDAKNFNTELEKLFGIIPRKMKKVADHLIKSDSTKSDVEKIISTEQDNLDSLISQFDSNNLAETDEVNDNIDLLSSMGLKLSSVSDKKIIDKLKNLMGDSVNHFSKAFEITNNTTQNKFDKTLSKSKNKKTDLFWHGSRNANWYFILQKGLLIRPSGAVASGSMFGDGVYFANKARKSIGYTSLSGSYWAGGNDKKSYLAVFEVHTGEQKHITRHNSSCYSLCHSILQKDGFDSVYAHGGYDLRNDEFIVYTTEQSTIKYLIEIK